MFKSNAVKGSQFIFKKELSLLTGAFSFVNKTLSAKSESCFKERGKTDVLEPVNCLGSTFLFVILVKITFKKIFCTDSSKVIVMIK
jgi:hypothetical protein